MQQVGGGWGGHTWSLLQLQGGAAWAAWWARRSAVSPNCLIWAYYIIIRVVCVSNRVLGVICRVVVIYHRVGSKKPTLNAFIFEIRVIMKPSGSAVSDLVRGHGELYASVGVHVSSPEHRGRGDMFTF